MNKSRILRLSLQLEGIVIFHKVKKDPVVASLIKLLKLLSSDNPDIREVYRDYHHFCSLATQVHWPDYLFQLLLQDENQLSEELITFGQDHLPLELLQLAQRDLSCWRELAKLTDVDIKALVIEHLKDQEGRMSEMELDLWQEAPLAPQSWPAWVKYSPFSLAQEGEKNQALAYLNTSLNKMLDILKQGTTEESLEALLSYYQSMGTGLFGQSIALKWQGNTKNLASVKPDPIRLGQLVNQEREQSIILENTEYFLKGYPANNIILYGNRGTGKSSLVKALLHEYCDQGLRLVELSKTDLYDYPLVLKHLLKQPLKFIIFIDDLSFEDTEADYKSLKTLLEGGLEAKPKNVLIYATSNRRHLVRETFSERQGDEVHRRDNMEEKLSLSDRFGITVTFPSPDQEGYLKIVEELALQEGLKIPREDLRQQALRWVMLHNARSGRTARQFIDFLVAKENVGSPR